MSTLSVLLRKGFFLQRSLTPHFIPIPIIIFRNFQEKNSGKFRQKHTERFVWKFHFYNFSTVKVKTNFISQWHVILAFICCIGHTFQANICQLGYEVSKKINWASLCPLIAWEEGDLFIPPSLEILSMSNF